ncbi:hypothetical protein DFP72DRAFT_834259, partial [Ephemerocybe angulata]
SLSALRSSSVPPPTPTSSRIQLPGVPASRKHTSSSTSRRREEFRLKKNDYPKDMKEFKKAFTLHIRILFRLLNGRSVPPTPPDLAITKFNDRFKSNADITHQTRSKTVLVAVNEVRCAAFVANSPHRDSRIAKTVRKMKDSVILFIDTCLARYGLTEWCPDFRQSAHSLYNAAHRTIAIDTFQQAAVSHAYASLKPNLKYAEDMGWLMKLYDHIVHHFFYRRYVRNLRNPGSVAAEDEANSAYHNRSRLAAARRKWLRDNGFPARYVRLARTKATSDDERDPDGQMVKNRPVFLIKTRPERSAEVTQFFRILDKKREREARLDPSRRWAERVRREPINPIETAFPSIPLGMAADYFNRDFFNSLTPDLRIRAASQTVALLPDVEQSLTVCEDECLSDAAF